MVMQDERRLLISLKEGIMWTIPLKSISIFITIGSKFCYSAQGARQDKEYCARVKRQCVPNVRGGCSKSLIQNNLIGIRKPSSPHAFFLLKTLKFYTHLFRLKYVTKDLGLLLSAEDFVAGATQRSSPRHDDNDIADVSNVGDGAEGMVHHDLLQNVRRKRQ